MKKQLTIALAGNPNAGKTTIFNNLTGAHQHVGNYPGVTVEKKEGQMTYRDIRIKVIDLPGTYSLTAYSPEEVVARSVLMEEDIDVVVNIVDAGNLERNMNLTVQLKELGLPMVVALNMVDMAAEQGTSFDERIMAQLLGYLVVPIIGTKNEGTPQLLEAVLKAAEGRSGLMEKTLRYAPGIEAQIEHIQKLLSPDLYQFSNRKKALRRWFAVKLLENDRDIMAKSQTLVHDERLSHELEKSRFSIQEAYKADAEMAIFDGRYAFVRGVCRESQRQTLMDRVTVTEKIDQVLLNRFFGLPIFLLMMWLLFQLTFTLGTPPMEWIDAGITSLTDFLSRLLPDGLLESLLIDGIIGGVGGVMVFLPNILLLFLGIAFLESTGYMARAAFVTDKFMHKVGLHGKSFIPMVLGFGCSIPAIMATRTLENKRDRLVTMLIVPLMSCGARLPVYTLLAAAFFDKQMAGNILFSIYLVGIVLAVLVAKVLRTWVLPGESEPFVMELPTYRFPTLKSILLQMWIRAWLYLKKAGTVILAASVIIWVLFTFPTTDALGQPYTGKLAQMENSYAGKVGHFIEPVIKPLGFDWKTGIALVAGFTAKEVVVSTMGTLYSIEEADDLSAENSEGISSFASRAREQSGYTPLVAYVLMLFVLIYVPCLATVAVLYRETNGWRWPLFLIGYTLGLAWVVCFVVYRVGLFLGLGIA